MDRKFLGDIDSHRRDTQYLFKKNRFRVKNEEMDHFY